MKAFLSTTAAVGVLVAMLCWSSGCMSSTDGMSANGLGGAPCTAGQTSTPNVLGDPCPQANTDCARAQLQQVASCLPNGTWGQCTCPGLDAAGASAGAGAGSCGNGIKDGASEECDGTDLSGSSCASLLGAAYKGTLLCTPQTCSFDTSMCSAGGTGPSGGAGQGG